MTTRVIRNTPHRCGRSSWTVLVFLPSRTSRRVLPPMARHKSCPLVAIRVGPNADSSAFGEINSFIINYLGPRMRFGVSCLCSHDEFAAGLRKSGHDEI